MPSVSNKMCSLGLTNITDTEKHPTLVFIDISFQYRTTFTAFKKLITINLKDKFLRKLIDLKWFIIFPRHNCLSYVSLLERGIALHQTNIKTLPFH